MNSNYSKAWYHVRTDSRQNVYGLKTIILTSELYVQMKKDKRQFTCSPINNQNVYKNNKLVANLIALMGSER